MGKEEITLRNYYYWKNEIDAFLNEKEDKSNKTSSWNSETNDNRYPTEKLVKTTLDTKENTSNKTSSWNSTTNNTRYPTEKLVKTSLDGKINTSALVNDLTTGGTSNVLSAEQGKILKGEVDGKSNLGHTHDDRYYTESEIDSKLASKENNNNKTLIWTNTPDNTRYPTEKLVKDSLDGKINTSAIKNDLTTGGATNVLSAEQGKELKSLIDNRDYVAPIQSGNLDYDSMGKAITAGWYRVYRTDKTQITDLPSSLPAIVRGILKVENYNGSSTYIYGQILHVQTNNTIFYRKGLVSGENVSWSDWEQVANINDIPDISGKVDKEEGKGLSTNDYTTTEKNKLANIEEQANNYTHPSYTARTGKPTGNQTPAFGGTATVSQITSDASGHVTGATDRTIKIPNTEASTTASGLMSKDDKTKLDGISTGAKNVSVEAKGSGTIEIAQITVDGTTTSIKQRDNNTTYTAASATPNMDGTGAVGTSTKYAREDHVHPTDTSRASTDVTDDLQTQINNITTGVTPTDHNHDSQYIKTGTGTVTTTNIANGTIKNEDISTSAAIAQSKINNLTNDLAAKNITLTKLSTPTNNTYIATYEIKQGETSIGKIDIPKDFLIQSASLEHCETVNTPLEGLNVGDPYIHFVANTNDGTQTAKTIDINVKDLVDTYKADNSTLQLNTSTNTFSIKSQGVTTTQIKNGTIINEDISSNAAISQSKIDGLITDLSGKSDNGHTHSQYLTSHQDISGKENTSNKTSSWNSTTNDTRYPTEKLVKTSLDTKENTSNKSTSITSSSTDTQYPSAKAVYSYAQPKGSYLTSHNPIDTALSSTSTNAVQNKVINSALGNKENTSNKSSSISTDTGSTSKYPTVKAVEEYAQPKGNYLTSHQDISGKENTSNKTSSWNSTPNNTRYPTEKLVKDSLDEKSTVSYTQTGTGTVEIGKINIDGTEIAIKQRDNNTTYTKAANTPPADTTDGTVGTVNKYALENHSHPKSDLYAEASHQHTKSEITDFPTSMTPTSHSHGSLANGGTLNSDITSVNKVAVTDSSNNLKTISKVPFANLNISKANITGLGIPASDTNTTYSADNSSLELSGTQFKVKDNGITSAKIQDGAVTNDKLTSTLIPNGTESAPNSLNNYTERGFYYQNNNSNTTYIEQLPRAGKAFFLFVEDWGSSNYTKQTLTHYDTNQTYTRIRNNGSWGTWKEISKNTTYSTATQSANGLMSSADKTKLDGIDTEANAYTHPSYTARTGVPTANATLSHGGTFTVSQPVTDATGHVTALNTRTYTLPADNNTTYSAEKGITLSSGKFGHSNTAITAQTTSALKKIKYDTYGHITGTDDVDASDLPSHTHTSLERTRELAPATNTSTDNDLNKLIVPGWYNVSKANAQLETIANIPEEDVAFRIEVQGQTNSNNYLTQIVYTTPTSTTLSNVYYRKRYSSYWSNWQKVLTLQNSANDTASNIKINGTQSAGSLDIFARADHVHPVDTSRAASSHTHGNITNAGAIGSAANKPIITTTSGKLTTGSFGTTANTFCQGNDSRLSDARTPLAHTHKGWDQKSTSTNWQLYINSDLGMAFFRYDAYKPGALSNNATFDILTSGPTVANSPLHGTSFTTENPYVSAWITAEGYIQVWTSDVSKFSKLVFSGFYLTST